MPDARIEPGTTVLDTDQHTRGVLLYYTRDYFGRELAVVDWVQPGRAGCRWQAGVLMRAGRLLPLHAAGLLPRGGL